MHEGDFKDYEVKCIKCSKPFTVTVAQQKLNQQKGLTLPKKCTHCTQGTRTNMHKGKKLGT